MAGKNDGYSSLSTVCTFWHCKVLNISARKFSCKLYSYGLKALCHYVWTHTNDNLKYQMQPKNCKETLT